MKACRPTSMLLLIAIFAMLLGALRSSQTALGQCSAYGDVNGDGVPLTAADLNYLIRYVKCGNLPLPQPYQADLNDDGVIDAGDVEIYQCYFISGISCFGAFPVQTVCNPSTVVGACVESNGDCSIRSAANCAAIGGTYLGNGTRCDTDGDALPDCWELFGYDHNNDGTVDVNLPALGAHELRKDVFVEIDWMTESPTHDHRPTAAALDIVVASFAAAPVTNPDGSTGIDLHLDYGQGGLWTGGNSLAHQNRILSPDPMNSSVIIWTDFDNIKNANMTAARRPIFHYCVFAHEIIDFRGISGISRGIPASDFVVSLGNWMFTVGTTEQQTGTFMHELGHNLGLQHGGSSGTNYKPNYLSVMNYTFQATGLLINGVWGNFDYSRFALPNLDESCINESGGLGAPAVLNNYGSTYFCTGTTTRSTIEHLNDPINWNCQGSSSESCVSTDINRDQQISGLWGFNDWPTLQFNGGEIGQTMPPTLDRMQAPAIAMEEELTYSEYQEFCVRRGDADRNRNITIADAVYIIQYIFADGAAPARIADGDPNGTQSISIADAVFLINYIFSGGPQPYCY